MVTVVASNVVLTSSEAEATVSLDHAEKDYAGRIKNYQRDWERRPDRGTQNILDDLREHDKPVLSTEVACG